MTSRWKGGCRSAVPRRLHCSRGFHSFTYLMWVGYGVRGLGQWFRIGAACGFGPRRDSSAWSSGDWSLGSGTWALGHGGLVSCGSWGHRGHGAGCRRPVRACILSDLCKYSHNVLYKFVVHAPVRTTRDVTARLARGARSGRLRPARAGPPSSDRSDPTTDATLQGPGSVARPRVRAPGGGTVRTTSSVI